ncbi:MAG TPA: CsgG/HfaB family protein [Methylomirabilota bacterium]|nr:CsgG/HfaB family protein [Methylomirabilota bacterium]
MSRALRFAAVLLLAAAVCTAQNAPTSAPKKRVAVMNFDYGTVRSAVAAIWGTDQDVGKGIADMLVQKLLEDGKFRVFERKALDKLITEQNFSNSDRADPATAAKLGKLAGVEAIIIGSITQFGRDDKKTGVGGFGGAAGRFGLGGVQHKEAKAVCAITARLVDTTTGEILASVTGTGESKRSGTSLVGAGGGPGGFGGGGLDMSSSNFQQTILGEAVTAAVASTASQLDDKAGALPTVKVEVSGLVADVSGNVLILNVGRRAGVQVGDKLEISRAVRTVKDPSTGKVLKTVTNKIGDAVVTEVDDDTATVTFTGSTPAKVGDVAKTPAS